MSGTDWYLAILKELQDTVSHKLGNDVTTLQCSKKLLKRKCSCARHDRRNSNTTWCNIVWALEHGYL